MTRIAVLGGTGFAGEAVVREAVGRGHQVTAYSRSAPAEPVEGATYVAGSVLDAAVLEAAVDGAEVVFEAISPRGDMAEEVEGVIATLIAKADAAGVRLGVLGGASSLLESEGGPRVYDTHPVPESVRREVDAGMNKLEAFRTAPASLDWFFLSPPLEFGAWLPQEMTGAYRTGGDVLLTDDAGRSYIAAADLALAVLDEIERPQHERQRFTVAR